MFDKYPAVSDLRVSCHLACHSTRYSLEKGAQVKPFFLFSVAEETSC